MTKEEIKKAILNATGNPESGVIKDNLGVMADAILKALEPEEVKSFQPVKETRIIKSFETR
jgi:hypothetical protein